MAPPDLSGLLGGGQYLIDRGESTRQRSLTGRLLGAAPGPLLTDHRTPGHHSVAVQQDLGLSMRRHCGNRLCSRRKRPAAPDADLGTGGRGVSSEPPPVGLHRLPKGHPARGMSAARRPGLLPVRSAAGGQEAAHRGEAVWGDPALPEQLPQGVSSLLGRGAHAVADQLVMQRVGEPRTSAPQRLHDGLAQRSLLLDLGRSRCQQRLSILPRGESHPAVMAGERTAAQGHHLTGGQQLIQHAGPVVGKPGRKDEGLPGTGRCRRPGELGEHRTQISHTQFSRTGGLVSLNHPLPLQQELGVGPHRDRLHLGSQSCQRATPDPAQHLHVAPFGLLALGQTLRAEEALHHPVLLGETAQRIGHHGPAQAQGAGGSAYGERSVGAGEPPHQIAQGIGHRVQEGLRDPGRDRHTQPIAEPSCILHRGIGRLSLPGHPEGALGGDQLLRPGLRLRRSGMGCSLSISCLAVSPLAARLPAVDLLSVGVGSVTARGLQPLRQLFRCQRAQQTQQVRHRFCGAVLTAGSGGGGKPAGGAQPLDVSLGVVDDLLVQELAQLHTAQELAQQLRIHRQSGGPALGQWGIALIEVLGDIAEEDGLGEGGRPVRGRLHQGDLPLRDPAGQLQQRVHVIDVLEDLAHGLHDHGEVGVARGDLQQLGGALTLLPQRSALPRILSRQQQSPRRGLPEAAGEERAGADLRGHQLLQLLGLKAEQLRPGWFLVHHGDP